MLLICKINILFSHFTYIADLQHLIKVATEALP